MPDVVGVYRLNLPAANSDVEHGDTGLTSPAARLQGDADGRVIFGSDVVRGQQGLSHRADLKRCWTRHLGVLCRLSAALFEGAGRLGIDRLKWLHDHGVVASRESDTDARSQTAAAKRTFHDGTSRRVFDLHTKPKSATGSDCCVRIYFAIAADGYTILIGWIGRHP